MNKKSLERFTVMIEEETKQVYESRSWTNPWFHGFYKLFFENNILDICNALDDREADGTASLYSISRLKDLFIRWLYYVDIDTLSKYLTPDQIIEVFVEENDDE